MVQDEPDTCRICSAPAERDAPLFHPCKCSGTIRYIHQDCLTTWLAHSKKKTCDVCKYQYSFTKIYSDRMPEQIPFILFMRKLAWNTFWATLQAIRGVMVAIIWLAFLPFVTVWTWRLYFNMGENIAWWIYDRPRPNPAPILYSYYNFTISSNRNGTVTLDRPIIDLATDYSVWRALSSDIFTGQIIATCITLMFLLVFLLREWIAQNARPGVFQDDLGNDQEELEEQEELEDDINNNGLIDDVIPEAVVPELRPILEVEDGEEEERIATSAEIADEAGSPASESSSLPQSNEPDEENIETSGRQTKRMRLRSDSANRDPFYALKMQESKRRRGESHKRILRKDSKNLASNDESNEKSPLKDFDFTFSIGSSETESYMDPENSKDRRYSTSGRFLEASSSSKTLDSNTSTDVAFSGSPPLRPHLSEFSIIDPETSEGPVVLHSANFSEKYEIKGSNQCSTSPQYVSTFEAPEDFWINSPHHVDPSLVAGPSRLAGKVDNEEDPFTTEDTTNSSDSNENDIINDSGEWEFDGRYEVYTDNMTSSSVQATATDSATKGDMDEYFREEEGEPPLNVDDILQIENVEARDEPDEDIDDEPQDMVDAQIAPNEADMDGAFEAIGLRGPLIAVFQHAALIIFVLDTTVGLAVWLPFTVGKTTALLLLEPIRFLHIIQWPIRVIRWFTDPIVDIVTLLLSRSLSPFFKFISYSSVDSPKADKVLQSTSSSLLTKIMGGNYPNLLTSNSTEHRGKVLVDLFENSVNTPIGRAVEAFFARIGRQIRLNVNLLKTTWMDLAVGDGSMNRFFAISLGYLLAGFLVAVYMNLLSVGNVQSAGRAIRTAVRQQLVVLKVAFFIITELVIFPFVCGSMLDLCSLQLFPEASPGTRIAYFMYAPATGFFYHWLCGTMYMYQFAVVLASCRKLIRPGGMWFIKDPSDRNFQPIRDILDRPTIRQLKKLVVSTTLYLFVAVVGTFSMVYCFKMWGSVLFPIRWKSRQPISQIPLDLLFLYIVVPSTMQQFRPRYFIYTISLAYWKWASKKLRISSYMFGGLHPDEMRPSKSIGSIISSLLLQQDIRNKSPTERPGSTTEIVDGSYRRVPANDNIALPNEMRATVAVTAEGVPIDEEGRQLMEMQNAEAEKAQRDPSSDYTIVYLPPNFKWRVILFLASFWAAAIVLVTSILACTIWLGRSVLGFFLENDAHDMYSLAVGIYLLWGCYAVGKLLSSMERWRQYDDEEEERCHRATFALYVFKRSVIRFSILAWVTFWLGIVIPILISLVVEVYLVHPFRIMVDPSLTLHINIYHSWALGIVYAKIYFSTLHLRRQARIDAAVNAMRDSGLMYLDVVEVTYEIIAPATIGLLGMLLLPMLLVVGLQQVIPSKITSNTLFLYIYPGIFIIASLFLLYKKLEGLFGVWAQQIRDTEFLVEMRLRNFEPPPKCDHAEVLANLMVPVPEGKELADLRFDMKEVRLRPRANSH